VEWIREMVARVTNAHLAAAEIPAQIDHRSLEAQAAAALARGDVVSAALLERQPTKHVGKNASALSRRGEDTERAENNSVIQRENEEQFQSLLAAFEREGRALPPSHDRRPSQGRAARSRGQSIDLMLSDGSHMVGVQGFAGMAIGGIVVPARGPGPSTQDLFGEAVQVWMDGALEPLLEVLKDSRRFLEDHARRLAAFADSRSLRADLRELIKRLKTLRRWATEWKRRRLAERSALKLLHLAEHALEQFVESSPRPTDGTEREWAKRRGRRLAAIEKRLASLKTAREAVSPGAEEECEKRLSGAVDHVEAWSSQLLKNYPLESDSLPPASGPVDSAKLRAEATRPPPPKPRLH